MGGQSSSTPQSGLSGLFLGNQPTQTGQQNMLAPITAPQSLIGQMDFSQLPSPVQPSSQAAATYTPPAPSRAGLLGGATAAPTFTADRSNPGYGWMRIMDGSEHGQPTYSRQYVSAPNQAPPAPAPVYQPSQSAQIAALINSQFGKK